jgi:hypothetical protein
MNICLLQENYRVVTITAGFGCLGDAAISGNSFCIVYSQKAVVDVPPSVFEFETRS